MQTQTKVGPRADEMYLDLLKKCLTRAIATEVYSAVDPWLPLTRVWFGPLQRFVALRGWTIVRREQFNPSVRDEGRDWPADAETMVGLKRLDNLQFCIERILRDDVPGDLIETGVWRGGASIFMRGALEAYGDAARLVWVADSFQGLPRPAPGASVREVLGRAWQFETLAVPLEQVQANFDRYGLLDDRVRFLVGWFRDTLPTAPIDRLALMRLDGDMYDSTMDALRPLYPKLSIGGFCIVDDYYGISEARKAVDDYREEHGIVEPIERIDWTGAFWQRLR